MGKKKDGSKRKREIAELEAKVDSYRQKVKELKAAAEESAHDADRWKAKAKEHKRRAAESRDAAKKALEVAAKAEKQARKAQKKARKALAVAVPDASGETTGPSADAAGSIVDTGDLPLDDPAVMAPLSLVPEPPAGGGGEIVVAEVVTVVEDVEPDHGEVLRPAVLEPVDEAYETWSLTRLRAEARTRGVPGYSRLPRPALVAALATP